MRKNGKSFFAKLILFNEYKNNNTQIIIIDKLKP